LVDLRDVIVSVTVGSSTGSGVRISANEILTVQHVVGTAGAATVSIQGEGLVIATVHGYDSSRDIALLKFTNASQGPFVELAQDAVSIPGYTYSAVSIGSEVAILGYVSSISETTPIATFGRVGVIWNIVPGDIRQLQFDAAITNGMSGGGVFNKYGDFVGVVLTWDSSFDANNRAVRSSEILEVLPDLRAGLKQ